MVDMGTVLIVDDNPNNLQILQVLLSLAGYRVCPALSGEIALTAVAVNAPDLILLDVRMPGIDGYETCRRIKNVENCKDIPIIFISAMHDIEDKLRGFRAGGVDYIAKPFQTEEVLARVATHVQLHRIQRQMESMVQQRTLQLSQSESRYRVLFEDSPIAILVFDSDTSEILAVNGGFTRMLGYTADVVVGRALDFAISAQQRTKLQMLTHALSRHSQELVYTGLLQFNHRDGPVVDIEGVLQSVDYDGRRAQVLMLQDVTASRLAEERLQLAAKKHQLELEQRAHYDALTGLPNSISLGERLRQSVEQVKISSSCMAVCVLDIDDFQKINEAHGAHVGDQLLLSTAKRLRGALRGGDTVARVGGDEFAMILLDVKNNEKFDIFLDGILQLLSEPFTIDGITLVINASIGVALYPQDDVDSDILMRHASQAMMAVKQSSKGRWSRFDPDSEKKVRAHQETIEQMRAALQRREFILYYQPKVDLEKNCVVGAEALIRWQHPERGLLPPGVFLPQIEGSHFMLELGDWVIDEALVQMEQWHSEGLDLAVSVNVAANQLMQDDFIVKLRGQLVAHSKFASANLELEVLETSSLDDIDKVEKIILACRDLGVGFSLDDFGTGYSSLTYLRRLSADTLKIDQSFIRDMMDDPGDLAIVSGVIGLANAFKRKVIAEGVETVAHGALLFELGCKQLQGYGIARPMPAKDMQEWVSAWPNAAWSAVMSGGSLVQDVNGLKRRG
jgi:diguanylate cyclase (GGDEF)-like protein/PAS domain S-box-containing protein